MEMKPQAPAKVRKPKKVAWPDNKTLAEMIRTRPLRSIGRELGVSDNAVRKRAIKLGLLPARKAPESA